MKGQQARERPNHSPKPRHRPARRANAGTRALAVRAFVIAVLAVATALTSLTGFHNASAATSLPSAPLNLEAKVISSTQIDLSWEPPIHAGSFPPITGYRIEVSTSSTAPWTRLVSDTTSTSTQYSHTGLSAGDYRRYRVSALDRDKGVGTVSNIVSTTLAAPTIPLFITANAGYKTVTLAWDPPNDDRANSIEKYQVRYAKIDGTYGSWTDVSGGTEARTHTVTGLTNFQRYKFQLHAVNPVGSTQDPPEVEATPLNFGMWVTNTSIKRGSNVVGERKTPVYVYAPGTRVESDTTFTLTWNGRPTDELHPDNPTTITIEAGEHIAWVYLWAAPDDDGPKVYNQKQTGDVVATIGDLQIKDSLIIFDDEPLPVVTLTAPATVAEGEGFRVTATLQHRLDVDTTVSVNMHNPSHMTVPGYSWPYPPISIPAGQLTGQTQEIRKQQDSDEDGYGDLAFGVNGISPYHWWPSRRDATVRVTDDDTNDPNKRRYSGWPRLYMGDANATESGDPDTVVKIRFPITLYPTSRSTITVDYRTEDDSAKAGVNYRSTNGTLTFAPREKQQVVEVDVLDDGLGGHTSFRFIAVGPNGGGAEIGTYHVTGRIYDETPTFRSWPESTRESGNGQEAYMNFHVSLHHGDDDSTYTIDYATADDTATAGEDYTDTNGTLTFQPGDGWKQVSVPILDDFIEDSGEKFSFILSSPTGGAQLNRWHHTVKGTILNKGAPGLSASFPNSAFTSSSHTGTDDRPQVVVDFSEAVAAFSKSTPSVKVANATITSIQAHTKDGLNNAYIFSLDPEGDDDITFALVSNADCNSGGVCTSATERLIQTPAWLTILGPNSTKSANRLSVTDATAIEEDAATIDFVVELDPASDENVTVDYATRDGSATAGYDYTAQSGTLTFSAGETSKTVQVSIIDDSVDENYETFTLALSNPDGAEISDGEATGTIVNLEPPPLTAKFTSMPDTHDGSADFGFLVEFNAEVSVSPSNFRDHGFTVTQGRVSDAQTIGSSYLWQITIVPDSNSNVTITLPGNRPCTTTGAACTKGDTPEQLSNSPSATVAGPTKETTEESTPDPLTASFSNVPDSHSGSGEFTFDLSFSENVKAGYARIRDHAFTISGISTIASAVRKTQGSNQTWTITVQPAGNDAITITLPETTDCDVDGAICTYDKRMLSNSTSVTISGPQ